MTEHPVWLFLIVCVIAWAAVAEQLQGKLFKAEKTLAELLEAAKDALTVIRTVGGDAAAYDRLAAAIQKAEDR